MPTKRKSFVVTVDWPECASAKTVREHIRQAVNASWWIITPIDMMRDTANVTVRPIKTAKKGKAK